MYRCFYFFTHHNKKKKQKTKSGKYKIFFFLSLKKKTKQNKQKKITKTKIQKRIKVNQKKSKQTPQNYDVNKCVYTALRMYTRVLPMTKRVRSRMVVSSCTSNRNKLQYFRVCAFSVSRAQIYAGT